MQKPAGSEILHFVQNDNLRDLGDCGHGRDKSRPYNRYASGRDVVCSQTFLRPLCIVVTKINIVYRLKYFFIRKIVFTFAVLKEILINLKILQL
jgi:hypothetical protein